MELRRIEKLIADDSRFRFTVISYVLVLVVYANLIVSRSLIVGFAVFVLYFLINGAFLANAFLRIESLFLRWMFAFLLLIMLLGFVGWLVLLAYNLGTSMTLLVLMVTTTVSSAINRKRGRRNVTR